MIQKKNLPGGRGWDAGGGDRGVRRPRITWLCRKVLPQGGRRKLRFLLCGRKAKGEGGAGVCLRRGSVIVGVFVARTESVDGEGEGGWGGAFARKGNEIMKSGDHFWGSNGGGDAGRTRSREIGKILLEGGVFRLA